MAIDTFISLKPTLSPRHARRARWGHRLRPAPPIAAPALTARAASTHLRPTPRPQRPTPLTGPPPPANLARCGSTTRGRRPTSSPRGATDGAEHRCVGERGGAAWAHERLSASPPPQRRGIRLMVVRRRRTVALGRVLGSPVPPVQRGIVLLRDLRHGAYRHSTRPRRHGVRSRRPECLQGQPDIPLQAAGHVRTRAPQPPRRGCPSAAPPAELATRSR